MSTNVSAIVLRFRDKGEDITSTINAHKEIINGTGGYVWWGWWAKDYENAPKDYFNDIDEKIKKSRQFKVFLLHTKQKKIYLAKCTEIKFSINEENDLIDSPEPEKTPSYYSSTKAKLWLKFTEISEYNTSDLCEKYSFIADSPQFFNNKDTDMSDIKRNNLYVAFDGCKVSGIDDFLIQKRTIWFLRNQRKNDEVTPVNDWKPLQDNYASHYVRTPHTSLLLLSDLHFSSTDAQKHNFALEDNHIEKQTLLNAILDIVKKNKIEIGGVLIAGDLTFIPCEEDFNLAAEFIEDLISELNIKTSQIAIVPGNHDISYDDSRDETEDIVYASEKSKEAYRKFYKRIFHVEANEYLCGSKRIILGNGLPIEIICANSSVLQQEKDLFVQGMIGRHQLQYTINQMDLKRDVKTYIYRVFLMHHHLIAANFMKTPEKKKRYSTLLDSGQVQRFLKDYDVNLVIHGHEHEGIGMSLCPHTTLTPEKSKKVDIIGLGSAGSSDLCSNVNNSFGILDFSNYGEVKYIRYDIVPNGNNDYDSRYEYSFSID